MELIENYLRFRSGGSSRAEAQTLNRCRFWRYPSFAPALAAQVLGRQVLIHEQNAVLGRANRVLCGLGAHLATSFGGTRGISKSTKTRTRKVGNPVRNDVLTAARGGYRYLNASRPFELLIFGGSQGASVFADTVPAAIGELPADLKARCALCIRYAGPIWHKHSRPMGKSAFMPKSATFSTICRPHAARASGHLSRRCLDSV